MKKLFFVFAITMFSVASYAQVGFKAGLVSVKPKATVDGFGSESAKSATGLQVGAYYNNAISESFSIQPEINFTFASNKSDDYKMSFVSIPVLGIYTVSEKIKLGVGPQLDYLTSYSSGGTSNLSGFKKIGFSGVLNGQYQVNEKIAIGIRYSAPIVGYKYSESGFTGNVKASVLGLYLVTGMGN